MKSAFDLAPGEGETVGRLLTRLALEDPHRPLVIVGDECWSRAELERRSNRRARQLAAQGVIAGDFVTIALPNGFEFYEAVFAVWKLGAIPNVVSSKLPPGELDAIVALAKPRLVLEARTFGPIDEFLSCEPVSAPAPRFLKAMTSGGSTGTPKIIVDHSPGRWDRTRTWGRQRPGDTVLVAGPLGHNAPFLSAFSALLTGGTVVDMLRFDALGALELIDRHRIDWAMFVPTMMHRIWRLPATERLRPDLSSLHTMLHIAAPCPPSLKRAWIEWLGPDRIFEIYAGTERMGRATINGRQWLERPGSVGRAQLGCDIRIFGEDGQQCSAGEVGEIFFLPAGGRGSTYHYIGAEAKALGEWESLGDMGYLDDDGFLYLVDRRTDLIISGGANIYPAEIEAALEEHPSVLSAVALGLPSEDLGQYVHAIVQRRDGCELGRNELSSFLSQRLAKYKIPRAFEFVTHALRDEAGKVRRSALRAEREGRGGASLGGTAA